MKKRFIMVLCVVAGVATLTVTKVKKSCDKSRQLWR